MAELKDIRLIALDLDDTTLCSDGSLADKTREAIETAINAGVEVVIASGRAFNSLPRAVADICGIRYAITSNGAAVAKNPGGERIVSLTLHPDTVQDVLKLFGNELLECFIDGQAYCDARYMRDPLRFGCSPAYVEYVKTTRLPVDDMPDFMRENARRLDSVDVLCASSGHRAELWERAHRSGGCASCFPFRRNALRRSVTVITMRTCSRLRGSALQWKTRPLPALPQPMSFARRMMSTALRK